jgi:hypothetical protein
MPTILCYMFSALLLLSFCLAHTKHPNLKLEDAANTLELRYDHRKRF